MFLERLLRGALAFGASVLIARHLGPEIFGGFSFALSMQGVLASMAVAGIPFLSIRHFASEPGRAAAIIGTSVVLLTVTSLTALGAYLSIMAGVFGSLEIPILAYVLIGLVLLTKPLEVSKNFLEANSKFTRIAQTELIVGIVATSAKLFGVVVGASVTFFAAVVFVEPVIALSILWFVARKYLPASFLSIPAKGEIVDFFRLALPFGLSGMVAGIHMRTDQVMLGILASAEELGYYAAAVRVSETWLFVPMVFATVAFPRLVAAAKEGGDGIELRRLLDRIILISMPFVAICVLAPELVLTSLFGPEFRPASEVLPYLGVAGLFAGMSLASGRWLLAKGYGRQALSRNLVGVCINVVLNAVLIPEIGARGASIATLTAFAVSGYLADAYDPRTRLCFWEKTKAILSLGLVTMIPAGLVRWRGR